MSGNAGIISLLAKSCVRAPWQGQLALLGLCGAGDGHPGATVALGNPGNGCRTGNPTSAERENPSSFPQMGKNLDLIR